MASTSFGHTRPATTTPGHLIASGQLSSITDEAQKLLSNLILRSLERTLLIGGALDTEALCVQAGTWVWRLNVHVTVLDDAGNLVDATVLAAMAGLRHYRKPQVQIRGEDASPQIIHSNVREPTPLPLHHTPLSISFALIHADDASLAFSSCTSKVAALVDPTDREELVQTGSISLAMNIHSEVCLLDFGGGCELQPNQLKQCWNLAEKAILQLCQMLEETLGEADTKAQQERLQRLQASGGTALTTYTNNNMMPTDSVPFAKDSIGQDFMEVDTQTDWKDVSADVESAEAQINEEEEAYRLQALDYAVGHVAAQVKERKKSGGTTNSNKPGSLLAAMLQSAQQSAVCVMASSDTVPAEGSKETVSMGNNGVEKKDISISNDDDDAAQDEFEQFAKKATNAPKKQPIAMDSDDEEETTALLTSEFQATPNPDTTKKPVIEINNNNNDDIDDLAMAIKKKKKKTKNKK
jgi:exosome complex component RRP45